MSPTMTIAGVMDNMIGRNHLFSMCEVEEGGDIMEVKVTNPKVVGKALRKLIFRKKAL